MRQVMIGIVAALAYAAPLAGQVLLTLPDAMALVREALDDVRAAADVIDAADLGDPDAEFALGGAEDHELAWYAPQELPFLLELM